MTEKRKVAIDDLYEIIVVGDAQISPDGERVAFLHKRIVREKDEYDTCVWIWQGGSCRPYTAGPKDSSPRWAPDGSGLAFLSKRGKKVQLFLLPASGGEATPITPEDVEVSGFVWSPQSDRIAFVGSISTDDEEQQHNDGEKPDEDKKKPTKIIERVGFKADGVGFVHNRRQHLHVVDVASGSVRRLTEGDFNAGAPAWAPDGNHIAFASNRNPDWDNEIDTQVWQVAASGGEPRRITSERGTWGRPVYSPDGQYIAFPGERLFDDQPATGFTHLWRVDRQGRGLIDLLEGDDIELGNVVLSDCKIEADQRLLWNERGIWFLVTRAGSGQICRWDGQLHEETRGEEDVRDFSIAGDAIAYTRSTLTSPAEIMVRRGRRKAEQITHLNDALMDKLELSPPEKIRFSGSDGEHIEGWVMRPVGAGVGKHPLILYIHGGPQMAYGNSFFHEMQLLASEGIGVMLINPHGSASHGKAFETSIHGDWGNRDFQDVMAAADFAAALDWVDDKRMAIGGGSYGGYMTSWTIGHTDRFAAAVVERSLVNMLSFVGTTDIPNWWPHAWRTTIETDAMKLWKMSPIAYLGDMHTPTLVIHSENDHRCPVEQGEQIFSGLRRRGVQTRFIRFPDESHGLSRGGKPSRRVERLQEILSWLHRYA